MSAGQVIFGLLSNDATVTGLVNGRIFPDVAPQRNSRPAIVYSEVSRVANNTLEASSSLDVSRYQITIGCTSRAEAETIGDAVRACLDYQHNVTYNGVTAQWIIFQSSIGFFDNNSDEDGLFLLNQDYKIATKR